MRQVYIAGNWKMNKSLQEAEAFLQILKDFLTGITLSGSEVIVCPPFPYLALSSEISADSNFEIGAQNVSDNESGAYTGEVAAFMLESLGCKYCIIGHSERRKYHRESNELINRKLKKLLQYKIRPIVCVGETLEERQMNLEKKVIINQLRQCFDKVDLHHNILVAYEPVWAIGTGRTATPEQAGEIHSLIRDWFGREYSRETAEDLPVLYGGSIKPGNIADLLKQPDIDGGLIGGASLDITKFEEIIRSVNR